MMIFEPRLEGHHISWLRYISEDFLSADFEITWAVDCRNDEKNTIRRELQALLPKVKAISLYDQTGNLRGGSKINAMAECFSECGADAVFANCFDEIASNVLRSAAVGIDPPPSLKGRISGVYLRPRFLENTFWLPGNMVKALGFHRLCRSGWFKCIFMTDGRLLASVRKRCEKSVLYELPDPWSGKFSHDKKYARKVLGISPDAFVFLQYGVGDRRKGLHLVVRALSNIPPSSKVILLCAGQVTRHRDVKKGLEFLKQRNMVRSIDRFVSETEESLCFCAADVVLLPYIKHFGSSGVLSRAAAAGKMVIASDEGLIAHLVRTHNLGWVFPINNRVDGLRKAMLKAVFLSKIDRVTFHRSLLRYATTCSRDVFRKALLRPFICD